MVVGSNCVTTEWRFRVDVRLSTHTSRCCAIHQFDRFWSHAASSDSTIGSSRCRSKLAKQGWFEKETWWFMSSWSCSQSICSFRDQLGQTVLMMTCQSGRAFDWLVDHVADIDIDLQSNVGKSLNSTDENLVLSFLNESFWFSCSYFCMFWIFNDSMANQQQMVVKLFSKILTCGGIDWNFSWGPCWTDSCAFLCHYSVINFDFIALTFHNQWYWFFIDANLACFS